MFATNCGFKYVQKEDVCLLELAAKPFARFSISCLHIVLITDKNKRITIFLGKTV